MLTNEHHLGKTRDVDFSGFLTYFGSITEVDKNIIISGVRFDLEEPYILSGEDGRVQFEPTKEHSETLVDREFLKIASLHGSKAYVYYIYGDSPVPAQTMVIITIYELDLEGKRVTRSKCFDIASPTNQV